MDEESQEPKDEKPLWPAGQLQDNQPTHQPTKQRAKLFQSLRENKRYVIKASIPIIIFWLLEFFYQYIILIPDQMTTSLIRSSALAGATLISIALIIGPLAKLTKYNYIFHRRTIGVWGFTFIIMHMITVMAYLFQFNIMLIWQETNPFINPVIFGLIAFWLFVPIYLTSTDWAVDRLGFKKWKNIHRLVYFAYIFTVLHYILISPRWFSNAANFLLLALTVVALAVQVLAFLKTTKRMRNKKDTIIGMIIILFGAVMFYLAYLR